MCGAAGRFVLVGMVLNSGVPGMEDGLESDRCAKRAIYRLIALGQACDPVPAVACTDAKNRQGRLTFAVCEETRASVEMSAIVVAAT